MENIENNKTNFFSNLINKYKSIFNSYKKTFILLLIILTVVSAYILLYFNIDPNTFYNCNSDDIVQYYPYISGLFTRIKNGTLSLYDTSLYGGVSAFSALYYIPIDIFLFIAFLLSYVMEVEFAYWFSLILKVCSSALLMYLVLAHKKFNKKNCLLVSLAYCSCGLLQAYVIFPVYLGIIFYAPLGMLLVDYFFESRHKTKTLILIPIFVFQVVLFDYYIAYMLLAFVSIYFVLEGDYKYKSFFTNKSFWIEFLRFYSFILLGLLMSAAILIPSFLYIINQTSRTSSDFDNFFLFLNSNYKDYSYGISYTHYFTQLINFFIPNYPNALCLEPAGGYVREHASFYMTIGLLIYFVRFFFIKDKKLNILKFFVFLLNLMFAIPLFSFIFSIQKTSYVRWFFIPYIFNILAVSTSLEYGFNLNKKKLSNIIPMCVLLIGLILFIWIFITNPTIFEHYSKTSSKSINRTYFYMLVISAIIIISIYLLNLLIPFIIKLINKNHIQKINFTPLLICIELVFSIYVLTYVSGSTSYSTSYTYRASSTINYAKNNLGYNYNNIERINLYTEDKNQANADIMYQNVNPYNFFQSFYSTSLNDYASYIHGKYSTFWSKRGMYGYSLVNGPMLNIKYVIATDDSSQYITSDEVLDEVEGVYLPSKYYDRIVANPYKYDTQYYTLKDNYSFIVYDSLIYKNQRSTPNNNSLYNDLALLNYCYVTIDDDYFDVSSNYTKNSLSEIVDISRYDYISSDTATYLANAATLNEYITSSITMKDYYTSLTGSNDLYQYTTEDGVYHSVSEYTEYDLTKMDSDEYNKLMSYDALYVVPSSSSFDGSTTNSNYRYYIYAHDADSNKLYPFHYNVGYLKELNLNIDKLYVYQPVSYDTKRIKIFGFNYSLYDEYLTKQASYTNRSLYYDDTNISLSFTKEDSKAVVVKLPLAYSSEWVSLDSNYKVVNVDAGFLGVVIPEGETNISISLKYNPQGYSAGLKITKIGCILYLAITSVVVLYDIKDNIRRREL